MLNLRLSDIARWTGGRLHGTDAVVEAVSTDTRSLAAGMLFVALKGERHDAHAFAETARERGAAALLVERELATALPQVVVADTLVALGELARAVRARSTARVVGITGSNGKTTVKTLVASILARHGRTHVNAGNFNNEIGLPLTLLAMPADTEYAVLEMGAGKPGDIAYLARIAQPDVALVNNIAAAHLERMGTLQGVAETKGAIYRALPNDGVAIINADDAFADYFGVLAGPRRVLRFGLLRRADVGANLEIEGAADGRLRLLAPAGAIEIASPLRGRHNVMNVLAAATLALALGVPLATIKAGIEAAPLVAGRLARRAHASGAVVVDDSYNANPGSFAAAIATLAAEPGERVLVMGDMAELGSDAERLHADIGALARRSGVQRLYAVGRLSRAAADAFGAGATHYADQAQLVDALRAELRAGVVLLVKGSRSSAMDQVVRALCGDEDGNGGERHAA
ncbi:UDP-N-acetylmuramoyl-tripeptide--D-alanyl-D-alanine ligase [Dokdonella fugitiva]|jgi:UDP-N-acetylmuramoyl-tripeptide--D-alanyl-D-alanine ligase|uniref:UDP-N-acetylmuramoyl-tripeptide--D-alanyl-D-alanine ligase n=1 Tax=Dokdonella fugitiva TaxID=328517 RepID=A0A4R2IDI6_9GAMM|nr:UDP-N-acetylmuramoyl-tripeptide--D-alanyl-D-alanine ligase [Dokdonella fugitiva]MBA8882531.1 UDP-N-acetylmuramoyl-tripeptide--D-alanyl-D-alanine ligase [Dokdonella fugitiva]TCO42671.1 UDP-N-acetylmuramoyl-tripeptide--D-alanyl-D-alanine ligase [Dokdonella fugitiva]